MSQNPEDSSLERERLRRLLDIFPKNRSSVLEIGARDGRVTRILVELFSNVTALDLSLPTFDIPTVQKVKGDVRKLEFADNSFDCVVCTEVLEHVSSVEQACAELRRVSRHEIVVGVPFRQDLRLGRTTCAACGRGNPPWGHVNAFDEQKLDELFAPFSRVSSHFVGTQRERTNTVSAALMDLSGNPWGTYHQEESCIHCGSAIVLREKYSLFERVCSGLAGRLNVLQSFFVKDSPIWMHALYRRPASAASERASAETSA